VLRNTPAAIAMSSLCGSKLEHATDPITPRGSKLHWRTPNQTRTQLIFYFTVMAGLPDLLFAKGPTLVQKQPEKSQILRQGAKKRSTVFSKVISSYKVK